MIAVSHQTGDIVPAARHGRALEGFFGIMTR